MDKQKKALKNSKKKDVLSTLETK